MSKVYISQSHAVSPLGENREETLENLLSQKSCLYRLPKNYFNTEGITSYIGQLPSLRGIPAQEIYLNAEKIKKQLLKKLFLDFKPDRDIDCVIFANNSGPTPFSHYSQDHYTKNSDYAFEADGTLANKDFIKYFNENFPDTKIHREMQIVNTCASGISAVGVGKKLISLKRARRVLVINYEWTNHLLYNYIYFVKLGVLPKQDVEQDELKLAFAKDRTGLLKADALAYIYLTSEDVAEKNQFKPLAEVASVVNSSDCHSLSDLKEDGEMIDKMLQLALKEAHLQKDDVDFISAHGTGTFLNDQVEYDAVVRNFSGSSKKVYLSSSKTQTGHSLSAASLVETNIITLILKHQFIPANLGLKESLINGNVVIPHQVVRHHDVHVACKFSFGFGGYNSIGVLKKVT